METPPLQLDATSAVVILCAPFCLRTFAASSISIVIEYSAATRGVRSSKTYKDQEGDLIYGKNLLYASLCLLFIAAFAAFIGSSGSRVTATSANRHYLITANGQGSGSTSFASYVSAAGGTMTNNMEAIGVVTADSSNPNLAANMSAGLFVALVAD